MSKPRRFGLDEITLRPGTYFNPQTEILIVVDDSPEVTHEIFEGDEFDGAEWVMIAEETPLDEHRRDDLIESFQLTHQAGGELAGDDLDDDEDDDEEEDELEGVELEGVEDLEPGRE
ncbi:MAG: hypothetical protein QOI03_1395 [Solirubrobacteraceae bacterium]|jgi:hypothetical protein|nr:hypothetical protein [Solirubrobacteraceae bacterium]